MNSSVAIIGAGGHGKVIADALLLTSGIEYLIFLDNNPDLCGCSIVGVDVVGGDDCLVGLLSDGTVNTFAIGLGGTRHTNARRQAYDQLIGQGIAACSVIHPTAIVSPHAVLGAGVQVLAGAIVNAGAVVGDNAIINTGAIVEHDCQIGKHVHVSTGCCLAGGVVVEDQAHVGIGSSVLEFVRIGIGATIGAGSVVTKNIEPSAVAYGCPAKIIRKID